MKFLQVEGAERHCTFFSILNFCSFPLLCFMLRPTRCTTGMISVPMLLIKIVIIQYTIVRKTSAISQVACTRPTPWTVETNGTPRVYFILLITVFVSTPDVSHVNTVKVETSHHRAFSDCRSISSEVLATSCEERRACHAHQIECAFQARHWHPLKRYTLSIFQEHSAYSS